jgi:hypothetical protein
MFSMYTLLKRLTGICCAVQTLSFRPAYTREFDPDSPQARFPDLFLPVNIGGIEGEQAGHWVVSVEFMDAEEATTELGTVEVPLQSSLWDARTHYFQVL